MITFNPDKRYTVEQCLEHDYFDGLHNPEAEPRCDKVFDWSWDNFELKKETLQKMVFEESLKFNPIKN